MAPEIQDKFNAISEPLALGSGWRVVVKESLAIAGLVTRAGSAALEQAPKEDRHANVVATLLDRNCAIIGRANMHELAFGMTGVNCHLGTVVNPRWPALIAGGSSSGSAAAVAAGLCDFAVGTDTGGSVRQPACCCGIYGLKPTYGRISREGAVPARSSLDCVGPLAPTARALTRAMTMMDGAFHPATLSAAPRLRAVECAKSFEIEPRVSGAIDPVIERVVDSGVELPLMTRAFSAAIHIINREMYLAFGELARSAPNMGADVRQRLLAAAETTDDDCARAEAVRLEFTQAVDAALDGVDALVLPAMPRVPPTLAEAADNPAAIASLTLLLRPFNLSGHPSLVIPIRMPEGMPAGLQLVGRKGDDAMLCAIAEWIEDQHSGPAALAKPDH